MPFESAFAQSPVAAVTSQKVAEFAIGTIVIICLATILIVAIGAKINDARVSLPANYRSHRGQMITVFAVTTLVVGLIAAALQGSIAIAAAVGFGAGIILTVLLFS